MHVVVASHQPLPAKGYGGPQRVVVALVRGLAALGHRITLLAPPGTRVPEATVVAVPPRKLADPATLATYVPRDATIVHAHFPLSRAPGAFPFVQTIHRNLKAGAPPYPNSIFLSRDHARRHRECRRGELLQQRSVRVQLAAVKRVRPLAFPLPLQAEAIAVELIGGLHV